MHPTVLIVAVLLLHGVSGHLFPRALPNKLTKHMQLHTRQSDAEVDECIDKRLEEALQENVTLAFICETAAEEVENDLDDDDDDDLSQSEVDAGFSVFCIPDCGNIFLSVADDCGYFKGDDAYLRDVLIGLCSTNENGDKCYESFVDAINITVLSEVDVENQQSCLRKLAYSYFNMIYLYIYKKEDR